MRHQAQKFLRYLCLDCIASKRVSCVRTMHKEDISSYDVVFGESFSNALAYTSQPYSEAMSMRSSLTYAPCATYSREKLAI